MELPQGRCVVQLRERSTRREGEEDHPHSLTVNSITTSSFRDCDNDDKNGGDDDDISSSSAGTSGGGGRRQRHWIYSALHPDEVLYGIENLSDDQRRETFYMGRIAMRHALLGLEGGADPESNTKTAMVEPVTTASDWSEESSSSSSSFLLLPTVLEGAAILKDRYGRPVLPRDIAGSITHKNDIAAALVSRDDRNSSSSSIPLTASNTCFTTTREDASTNGDHGDISIISSSSPPRPTMGVGIDIEHATGNRSAIARKILTQKERDELGQIEGISYEEEVLLRFSLKESLYKAMHPLVCRYVGFQEAEIQPYSDGSCDVALNLTCGMHEHFDGISAHWIRFEGDYFLTSASVCLGNEGASSG